jgi:flagellum-specific peptidoglycan hydrolase FlgJ
MSAQTEFIDKHKLSVIEATKGTKLFPSVKMAQMIIESGWGKSANARLANNYFGIKKGTGWTGETIVLNTPKDGKPVSTFRKYKSVLDSVIDHSSFLIKNKRYENNGVFSATTPEQQVKAIFKAGYAEAKNYENTLNKLIAQYNLKELDKIILTEKKSKLLPVLIIAGSIYLIYLGIKK